MYTLLVSCDSATPSGGLHRGQWSEIPTLHTGYRGCSCMVVVPRYSIMLRGSFSDICILCAVKEHTHVHSLSPVIRHLAPRVSLEVLLPLVALMRVARSTYTYTCIG